MTDQSAERIALVTTRSESEARDLLAKMNPNGRLVTAEEVAAVHPLSLPAGQPLDHRRGADRRRWSNVMSLDPFILEPTYFRWDFADGVGTITLDRPERKNPLTFDSYAELRDLFRALGSTPEVKAIVLAGAGGNFCSGGDVHEIIGPLTTWIWKGCASSPA